MNRARIELKEAADHVQSLVATHHQPLAMENVRRAAQLELLAEAVASKRAAVAALETDVIAAKREHEALMSENAHSLIAAKGREDEAEKLKALIGVAQRVDEDTLRFATKLQEKLNTARSCTGHVRQEVQQVRAAFGQQRTESLGSDADRKLFELRLKVRELSTTLELGLRDFYGARRLRSAIVRDDLQTLMGAVRAGESRWLFESCTRRECVQMRTKVLQMRQRYLNTDSENEQFFADRPHPLANVQ